MLFLRDDPQQNFIRMAGLMGRKWGARLSERFRHTGLTPSRWALLLRLCESDTPLTQSELAGLMGIEGPTLVRQLNALEKQGLVVRCSSEKDRRVKVLMPTSKAEPLLKTIEDIAAALRKEVMAKVSGEELEQAVSVLNKVVQALLYPDAEGRPPSRPGGGGARRRVKANGGA